MTFSHTTGRRSLPANALVKWCLALGLSFGMAPAAHADNALERGVKAAFLYKFTGYVEWPANTFADAETPIVIAVNNAPEIAEELERIVPGRRVNNRPLAVKRVREGDPLNGVNILFVGGGEAARTAAWARAAQSKSLVIVTEAAGALAVGSSINFTLNEGKVRFEASPETAEKSGVKLSSRLLSVALAVRGGAQ